MLIKTGDAEIINIVEADVDDETQRKAALNAALELPKSKANVALPIESDESPKDRTEN